MKTKSLIVFALLALTLLASACAPASSPNAPAIESTTLPSKSSSALRSASIASMSPVTVSERTELTKSLVGTGFAYQSEARAEQARVLQHVLPRVRDVRRAGSAALDLATVACGRFDGFYEAHLEEWDKAAGILLVCEAGGRVREIPPGVDTDQWQPQPRGQAQVGEVSPDSRRHANRFSSLRPTCCF